MAVWPSLPPIDSCRPVFSSRPPDGIPFHNAYMFERSEKGHVILPADWDDSEDDVYDQYAK